MNAMTTLDPAFQAPVSSVFSGMDAGDDLSGGITGGYGLMRYRGKVWAIHYQQQDLPLMRDDGDGPRGSIDVVLVKANPHLSKTWYENGWDENSSAPPDCASANGVVPDAGVPKRQSMACANCPRNQWGTAPNGGKGKACADHRRLAIVPLADIDNEAFGGPLLLRCPAASLQDLAAFDNKYKQAGYPYYSIGVKISFDAKESYPKLVFNAIRPLTDDEARKIVAMRQSDAVARVVGETAVPAAVPAQVAGPVAFSEAPAGAPVSTVVGSPQTSSPAAAPQPAPAAAARPAPNPAPAASPVQQTTGFGAVAAQPVQQPSPQPAQQPQQPRAQQMSGFGPAAVQSAQAPQHAAPQQVQHPVQQVQPQPVQPQQVTQQFDASLDDKLAALIGNGS